MINDELCFMYLYIFAFEFNVNDLISIKCLSLEPLSKMLLQLEPQMKSHKKKNFKRIICGGETGRTTVVF